MPKRMGVGNSWHTQAKHALMSKFIERELTAANSLQWIRRLPWIDLTAGDGIPTYEGEWHACCSPGILAYHASMSRHQPVWVELYEKDPATYGKLLASLGEQLPILGYVQVGENQWRHGERANLRALNVDGRKAQIDYVQKKDAVLVLNDPNSITEWAMRRGFANEILDRPGWVGLRILSTLGCNVCGIKMLPLDKEGTLPLGDGPEVMSLTERKNWFKLISEQVDVLPEAHDLLLAAFERDSSQWAYLMSVPSGGRTNWVAEAEEDVQKAFATAGRAGQMAWLKQNPERFERTKDALFYTQAELFKRANQPLFGETPGEGGAA
jgi:hypothetical protein